MKARLTLPLPQGDEHTLNISQNGRVVLFGEVLADIFPDRTVLGGAPFNVARHLKAFGRNPVLLSRVGNDDPGRNVLGAMAQNAMETGGIQIDMHRPTGQVKVHLENGGHCFDILPDQAYDFIHPAVARMVRLPLSPALVYYGTLAQRHEVSRRALTTLLRSTSAAKFLDVNLRAPWYDEKTLRSAMQNADIVKLNAEELEVLARMFALPGYRPQNRVMELMRQFDLEQVVVTCGAEGAWQMSHTGKVIEAVEGNRDAIVVDTVGAGDGFTAVYILGMLQHWPMENTLARANTFAAAICGIRGAVPDYADFYQPFTEEWGL
ncbi:MAG: carbohydrate kinase [Gallionella sp.]|nr:carbohydrate kinase [Gallionella sp.]